MIHSEPFCEVVSSGWEWWRVGDVRSPDGSSGLGKKQLVQSRNNKIIITPMEKSSSPAYL
jgi:hypothetical protein